MGAKATSTDGKIHDKNDSLNFTAHPERRIHSAKRRLISEIPARILRPRVIIAKKPAPSRQHLATDDWALTVCHYSCDEPPAPFSQAHNNNSGFGDPYEYSFFIDPNQGHPRDESTNTARLSIGSASYHALQQAATSFLREFTFPDSYLDQTVKTILKDQYDATGHVRCSPPQVDQYGSEAIEYYVEVDFEEENADDELSVINFPLDDNDCQYNPISNKYVLTGNSAIFAQDFVQHNKLPPHFFSLTQNLMIERDSDLWSSIVRRAIFRFKVRVALMERRAWDGGLRDPYLARYQAKLYMEQSWFACNVGYATRAGEPQLVFLGKMFSGWCENEECTQKFLYAPDMGWEKPQMGPENQVEQGPCAAS